MPLSNSIVLQKDTMQYKGLVLSKKSRTVMSATIKTFRLTASASLGSYVPLIRLVGKRLRVGHDVYAVTEAYNDRVTFTTSPRILGHRGDPIQGCPSRLPLNQSRPYRILNRDQLISVYSNGVRIRAAASRLHRSLPP